MLSVITFKYRRPDYRTEYTSAHANALAAMTRRYYNHPHRFYCVTDDPGGLGPGVEYVPLWPDHLELVNPSHPTSRPNCYPRLKLFAAEMEAIFGKRFVSIDLDTVMVNDLAPLWHRREDFLIYDARGDDHYNGSMFMMTAGARREVWDRFHPVDSPRLTTAAGMKGSDQAWIRYCLSPHAATWHHGHGAYAYLNLVPPLNPRRRRVTHGQRRGTLTHGSSGPVTPERDGRLPGNARIVFFAGRYKPWDADAQELSPWIKQHHPLAS